MWPHTYNGLVTSPAKRMSSLLSLKGTRVSDFLIKKKTKNSVSNYSRHRCATNFVDYLREFEAIFKKALILNQGPRGKLFEIKKTGRKSE
jgi:hypothetical protein